MVCVGRSLHRREYHFAVPSSLWHADGYHKLIRWKIIIHGGIDGFSRLITYLHASTNNRAANISNQCDTIQTPIQNSN